MIPFKVVTKIQQDVKPEIVANIAEQFLEWLEKQGWQVSWGRMDAREPKARDGSEMGYQDMAQDWVRSLEEVEE